MKGIIIKQRFQTSATNRAEIRFYEALSYLRYGALDKSRYSIILIVVVQLKLSLNKDIYFKTFFFYSL